MDSERRASDNEAPPLVSISSKVINAHTLRPSGDGKELVDNLEPSYITQPTSYQRRQVNGDLDHIWSDSRQQQPPSAAVTTRPASITNSDTADSGPVVLRQRSSLQLPDNLAADEGSNRLSGTSSKGSNVAGTRMMRQVSIVQNAAQPSIDVALSRTDSKVDGTEVVMRRDRDTSQQRAALNDSTASGASTGSNTVRRRSRIGHRRVDEAGTVTYKRTPTGQLMHAIQMGIWHSIMAVASKPERDILISDFRTLEFVEFPSRGTHITPPHEYSDFTFKTYAPFAFRFFRALFGIKSDQFINSLTSSALIELSNPGASGSIFYLSPDYDFIIKTVQKKEAHFLQKLLPGYYLNLNQNPRTLLPKFYGLYCYCSLGKKIRFVVMNNLLPTVVLHEKYDLKGSTFKREASDAERAKRSPTLKDLDFRRIHPEGLEFDPDSYQALVKTLQRDCRVLESFRIMDYSLLLGIHNLDRAKLEQVASDRTTNPNVATTSTTDAISLSGCNEVELLNASQCAGTSRSRMAFSTASEMIDATRRFMDTDAGGDAQEQDAVDSLQIGLGRGGIPARNSNGERLLVYAGIIDILQYYRLAKRLEHAWKSVITDGDTVSVHHPSFYADRFLKFCIDDAFKKGQARKYSSVGGSIDALEQLATLSSS